MTLFLFLLAVHGPDPVNAVLSEDGFHQRLAAVHSLDPRLSPQQVRRLCAYLGEPQTEPGIATLKNDLINALRSQDAPSQLLVDTLLAIYKNPQHGDLMRDYAIQHLAVSYHWARNKDEVRGVLHEALEETGSSIGGTALLALERLGHRDQLAEKALQAAVNTAGSELTRIAALRICGRLEHQPALPLVRSLAGGEANISLRMAAIATLGEIGDLRDLSLLQDLQNGLGHPRLIPAAQRAAALIKKSRKAGI